MTEKQRLGQRGEELARLHLEAKGYRTLETNWRHRRAEIDLILMDDRILVFVEVKTRGTSAFGHPLLFMKRRQTQLLSAAATAYMDQIGHDWEIRFDLVSVVLPRGGGAARIEHVPDAFFPGLHDWR